MTPPRIPFRKFPALAALAITATLLQTAKAQTTPPPSPAPVPTPSEGLLPLPDYSGDLAARSKLTGDWGGLRTDLANKGVQADIDATHTFQSITQGGLDTGQSAGGHWDYLFHFDLMRMGVLPGALVTVRAETKYGTTSNGESGQILPVNTNGFFPLTDGLDDDLAFTITDLNLTQFLSPKFAVILGKLDTLDADFNEFASGRGKSQFTNANFVFSSVTALRLPYSTLGAGVVLLPTPDISIKAVILNTADSSTTTGFDGFGDGTTATAEADFQYRLGSLPGGFNIGGLYSFDQNFPKLRGQIVETPVGGLAISDESETWAVYASAWQYLYVEDPSNKPVDLANGKPDHQGFGLFARGGISDKDTNPDRWSISAGIGGKGMIPGRPNDLYGLGYYYADIETGVFLSAAGINTVTQGAEAFYNIALTPAAQLSFNVQALESLFGTVQTTTIILGARLNLEF